MKWLFIVLLFSCNGVPAISPKLFNCEHTIKLRIDNLFSKAEQEKIREAVSNWTAASNNRICFNIEQHNTKNDERTFLIDGKRTIYSWKRSWQIKAATTPTDHKTPCPRREDCLGITIWSYDGEQSDIFILSNDFNFFLPTVEHEIGHMIGLSHTGNYDNIMYMYLNPNKKIGNNDKKVLGCLIKTGQLLNRFNVCF